MNQSNAALKKYKITIEVLSGFCTGGGETSYYSSDEYILSDDRIYLINFKDILNLREKNILTDREIEKLYDDINKKKDIDESIKAHLKSIKLNGSYDNRLNIHRFASIQQCFDNEIKEIKGVMGSSIKGLFRHGFEISKINSVNYVYSRASRGTRRLRLEGVEKINDNYYKKDCKNKFIHITKFPKGRFTNYYYKTSYNKGSNEILHFNKIKDIEDETLKEYVSKNSSDIIFKNTIFEDCLESNANFAIEKVCNWNRKLGKFITPQYYEIAEKGSLFEGKIIYKYIPYKKSKSNDKYFTRISLMYEDKSPIEEAFNSLKIYYAKVIDLEEKFYTNDNDAEIKEFYRILREENNISNQVVVKLGYSGAVSKTLLCYDNKNDKEMLLPFTLKYMIRNKLPFGWVKIKLEEIKDEN